MEAEDAVRCDLSESRSEPISCIFYLADAFLISIVVDESCGRLLIMKDGADIERQGSILKARFFTCVFLGPPGWRESSYNPAKNAIGYMLHEIQAAARLIAIGWEAIMNHFKELLDQEATFLESDQFVKLLFEDDTYSRSRRYFWILGSLQDIETTMKDSVTHWLDFKKLVIDPFQGEEWAKYLPDAEEFSPIASLAWIEEYFASIDLMRNRLKPLREQVTLLRDGVRL